MAVTDPQTNIRLPRSLKDRLGTAAKKNARTLNAEILYRLERSFGDAPETLTNDAIKAVLETREMLGQFLGDQTFAQHAQSIGPINGAKGIKAAYQGESLVTFVKEFGVKELLVAIGDAAQNLDIKVTEYGEGES
jgi:hypothetical protein